MKVKSLPTLSDPMDCSLPGSSVHGIFQAKVLEWGAIAFSDSAVYGYLNGFHVLAIANSAVRNIEVYISFQI